MYSNRKTISVALANLQSLQDKSASVSTIK
jgi:hypothetical protein